HSRALLYFEIFAVIAFVYNTYALVRAVRRKREGAFLILTGAVCVFLIAILDMLFFWGLIGTSNLTPVAIICMIIIYSLILSKRFSDEFERQRILTAENASLLETVRQQVVQLSA